MPHLQPLISFDAGAPSPGLPFRLVLDIPGRKGGDAPDITGAVFMGMAEVAGLMRSIAHALDDLALAGVDHRPEDIMLPAIAQSTGTLADGLNLVGQARAVHAAGAALSLVKGAANG
ncbi:MAG: hypothetical protein MUE77_12125 [Sandarakinorhabdus sp.]|jgi:hypothetical protein|nr:hypothetical protein [Sandarakinorhabdus sp.]